MGKGGKRAMGSEDLRGDWELTPEVRQRIVEHLVAYTDTARNRDRTVIAAARTIATLGSLNLAQQRLDLDREKFAGRAGDGLDLAEILEEAARLAAERRQQRGDP